MRQISLQGHRGARGLLAENTLPSLAKAFEHAMHGIEFDVQLSKDDHIVIYHDLRLKSEITRDASGHWISDPGPGIRSLNLKQLKQFKLGRVNKNTPYGLRFRKQRAIFDESIPTLDELVEHLDKLNLNDVILNIEIKHSPLSPELCPPSETLARKVVDEIHRLKISKRCIVQCFNWSVIDNVRKIDKSLALSCLTIQDPAQDTIFPANGQKPLWNNDLDIREFNYCVPDMAAAFGSQFWSPYYKNLSRIDLRQAHRNRLKVMTWTVNHKLTMKRLFNWGVDGIISDYPDRLHNSFLQWRSKSGN